MSIERARALRRRLGWINSLRPMVIGAFFADALSPDRRTIVEAKSGALYFVDPLSNIGQCLVDSGSYELETEQILREHLAERDSFLDVGANEGYFSVLAASIVGTDGYVASVEPQSRLSEIIRINLALNGLQANIFHAALGGTKGDHRELHLSPSLNSGFSSLSSRPRFSRRSETVNFIDSAETLAGRPGFAVVKVDVEGFENEVVDSLLPLIEKGQVRALVVDYHASLLQARGIEPAAIERKILDAGMSFDGNSEGFSGYRLYIRK
jgi:FkbM family methyltransferase